MRDKHGRSFSTIDSARYNAAQSAGTFSDVPVEAVEGFTNDYHLAPYGKFALGGFGLVMLEATAVSPEGRITHGDVGLWNDAHIDGLARIAKFIKKQGAAAGIQIAHAGPKASMQRPYNGDGPLSPEDEAVGIYRGQSYPRAPFLSMKAG